MIGCSGAGKSSLARALAAATGLPLIHLDAEHWRPGWTEPDPADWFARCAAMEARPRWIIDGLYGSTMETRLKRATLIVWLDLPTWVCLWGAIARWRRWRGRTRPDMGPDCPEKFDVEFLRWIVTFRRAVRPRIVQAAADSDATIVRLTSILERRAFSLPLEANGLAAAMASPG